LGREVEKHILTAKRDVRREISLAEMGKSLERSAVRLESFLVDHSPSPSSHIHRHERMIQLANHLAAMPEDYRRILILRHCEGLPFKEIAQKMARSEGAVRMLWLRAIGYMRERLSGGELS
jgi:RNA polymerase sigma-70 factor (ECF subfamily)